MTARVDPRTWAAALGLLNRVRPRQSSKPILQCVLAENGEPGLLRLSATDLETGAVVTVPCEGGLSAPILARELPKKPRGFVELDGAAETYTVKTADGAGQYVQAGAPDDFPSIGADARPWGSWDAAAFLPALEYALRAAAREVTRYAINSVCLQGCPAWGLSIVATDAHRLHWTDALDAPAFGAEIMLPVGTAGVLARFAGHADAIRVSYRPAGKRRGAEGAVEFRLGEIPVTLAFRPVEGNFPKWREAIPDASERDARAVLDSKATAQALKAGTLYTSRELHGVTIRECRGRFVVSGRNPERGEGHAWGGTVQGALRPVAVDPALLADAVNGAATVEVRTIDYTRPVTVYSGPHGAVVMPVRIHDDGGLHSPPEGEAPPLAEEPERPKRRRVARAHKDRTVAIEGATFAEKVYNGRRAAGLSLKALAALYGRDTSTVWRWEKGKLAPDRLTQAGALAILAGRLG